MVRITRVAQAADQAVLRIEGWLSAADARLLQEEAQAALQTSARVVLDLHEVRRIDRSALPELLDSPRVTVYGVTESTAEFYSAVLNSLRQAGTPIPTNTSGIAAVTLENGRRLYSLDQHFASVPGLVRVPVA